jgi:glyoxylase-like metal-dependent hydrolase (beta-lactamase superfamily II)
MSVDAVELTPNLAFLPFPVGHVYLWHDADGLALIDAGVPGSAPAIAAAIRGLGRDPAELRHLVLTHFHVDHVGAAAEIATWGDVRISAHRIEAPVIEGSAAGPDPVLSAWEEELLARVQASFTATPPDPVRVDRRLEDGDVLDFGGGAHVVWVPGHTPGSAAIHLPAAGVLFTGDTIARRADGRVILGVFNVDSEAALASMRRQAALDVEVACFGHGEPVTAGAGAILREAADRPR